MKINQYGSTNVSVTPGRTEDRRTSGAQRGAAGAQVSISSEARQLEQVQEKLTAVEDVREHKIQEARLALIDGSLDDEAALEQALDRLIPDLF